MSDFDRLLNLAQKSNGKIFIYDKCEGRHMLLVNLDEYEEFLNFQEELDKKIANSSTDFLNDHENYLENNDEKNFFGKSLIEKINNDIAVWKSKYDEQKIKEEADDMEEKLIKKDWHSISEILNKKNSVKEVEEKNKVDELFDIKKTDEKDKKAIPFLDHEETTKDLKDIENVEDEPIFFEEPV